MTILKEVERGWDNIHKYSFIFKTVVSFNVPGCSLNWKLHIIYESIHPIIKANYIKELHVMLYFVFASGKMFFIILKNQGYIALYNDYK